MRIDNTWYDDLGEKWWDRGGPVGPLHEINPARFNYFKRVLNDLRGLKVLDVGCGGGILSESFAQAGALVTGIDFSLSSLVAAGRHSGGSGLSIDFVAARGEALPFMDSSFDVVVSADFLEHVPRLDIVIGECSRVLKPEGFFLYDTINRTLRARVVAVWLLEWVLGLIPKHTHDPRMFIKPPELYSAMIRHGIHNRETRGLAPQSGPGRLLVGLVKRSGLGSFKITDSTAISYIGYGVKSAK